MAYIVHGAQKGVELNWEQFHKTFETYCIVMKMRAEQALKQQARYMAIDMCDYTPPFAGSAPASGGGGFSNAARDKGRASVSRDIRRIFSPIEQAPASAVAKTNVGVLNAWMTAKLKLPAPHQPEYIFKMAERTGFMGQGEFDYFQRVETNHLSNPATILMGTTESRVKSIHVAERGSPGYRLNKNLRNGKFFVDNFDVVKRYIKGVQQRVGKLKSGWYFSGSKLGRMPRNKWISGQGADTVIYRNQIEGPKPTVTIGSSVGANISQGYHFRWMAIKHREYSMRVKIFQTLKGPGMTGRLEAVVNRIGKERFDLTETLPQ